MYLLTLMILTFMLPLIVVSGSMKKGMHPYAVILQSILFLGFSLVALFAFAWSTGEPLGVSILKEVNMTVKNIVEAPNLLKMVGLAEVEKAEATEILTSSYALLINVLPSSIICWGIVFSYFDYAILSKIKRRTGKDVLMLPDFSRFSLPMKAGTGCLLIYVLSWLTVSMGIVPAETMLSNVEALILFVFSCQGLAVVVYTTRQKKIPKALRWIVYISLFLSGFGRTFLALLGVFDLLVGIRQKLENK